MLKRALRTILGAVGFELRRIRSEQSGRVGEFTMEEFAARERYRSSYKQLCEALLRHIDFETVLDIGSANGFVIDILVPAGKEVRGVELSDAVKPLLSPNALERTTFADITRVDKLGVFDLVTCIEVAEHIPPERSEALVDAIVRNASRWVYFTAATPYQDGYGHINCRPHFYWLDAFRERGFELDFDVTRKVVTAMGDVEPAKWLPLNSLILRRFP